MSLDAPLPPIDQSLLPADVRAGGPQAQQLYGTALGFESLLVDQLTTELAQSAGLGGSDGSDGSGGSTQSPYASLLPDALAQAVTAGGGLGLADQLYRSLALRQGTGSAAASPGAASDATQGTVQP